MRTALAILLIVTPAPALATNQTAAPAAATMAARNPAADHGRQATVTEASPSTGPKKIPPINFEHGPLDNQLGLAVTSGMVWHRQSKGQEVAIHAFGNASSGRGALDALQVAQGPGAPRLLAAGETTVGNRGAELPLLTSEDPQAMFAIQTAWVSGTSLRNIPPATEGEAVRSVLSLLAPLARLHRAGWVHGKVKDTNIRMDPKRGAESLTLVDFSSVERSGAAQAEGRKSWQSLGDVAPEQLARVRDLPPYEWTPATDVFGAAKTLATMLTGERLFPEPKSAGQLSQSAIMWDVYAHPRLEGIKDPGLEKVLAKALSFDPADRYQSAEEFHEALKPFQNSATRLTYADHPGVDTPVMYRGEWVHIFDEAEPGRKGSHKAFIPSKGWGWTEGDARAPLFVQTNNLQGIRLYPPPTN